MPKTHALISVTLISLILATCVTTHPAATPATVTSIVNKIPISSNIKAPVLTETQKREKKEKEEQELIHNFLEKKIILPPDHLNGLNYNFLKKFIDAMITKKTGTCNNVIAAVLVDICNEKFLWAIPILIEEKILTIDENLSYRDGNHTPLTLACFSNMPKVVLALFEAQADPNKANDAGKSPLKIAIEHKRHYIANILIRHGANPVLPQNIDCLKIAIEYDCAWAIRLLVEGCRNCLVPSTVPPLVFTQKDLAQHVTKKTRSKTQQVKTWINWIHRLIWCKYYLLIMAKMNLS